MIKKGGHGYHHHHHHLYYTDPGTYLLIAIPIAIVNGYIFGLKYIKKEETKTNGIIMLTASTIGAIFFILFIGLYLYANST